MSWQNGGDIMLLEKYCKDTDLMIIQFTIELTKDIHAKISARASF